MQTGLAATGRFETENASKYLQQLCKHFAHKVQARCDDRSGEVALGTGPCRLWADASELRVEVMAPDAEELDQAKRDAFAAALKHNCALIRAGQTP